MMSAMRPVEALYENGLLRPAKPLNLRPGERVALIVVRHPDPSRWDLARLGSCSDEDEELASAGLDDWKAVLDREDNG
jgi:predicted DNA-binding antitoxin AbrB/MazE fold protein